MEQEKHYVCLGECEGVSKNPGVCQAVECDKYNHDLTACSCRDGEHKGAGIENLDSEEEAD